MTKNDTIERRYQIFISSTYSDLIEERRAVMDAILNLKCFPSGMEMFPSVDMEQFEYIKQVIDESDYYVLILAGRYGSVAEDGVSFTEKEYDYAVNKGIPVIVLVYKDIEKLRLEKCEKTEENRKKLQSFREKVMNGRLCTFWNTSDDLKYQLSHSLTLAFEQFPRNGWVKASCCDIASPNDGLDNIKYSALRNAIYKINADGTEDDGPYCTRCWEVDKKFVTIHQIQRGTKVCYKCPQCQNITFVKELGKAKPKKLTFYDEW